MPTLTVTEPAIVRLDELTPQALERAKRFLTFKDGGVKHMLAMHRKKFSWKRSDPAGWLVREQELKDQLDRCILFNDGRGYYTYSGLAQQLVQSILVPDLRVERRVVAPVPSGMAWDHAPANEARYYQPAAENALIDAVHGAVEMGTGLGKSRILLDLTHRLGLRTLIVAPSTSILTQLVKDFQHHLGDRYVGQYGDGKKKFDRQVTIATFQSLTRLTPTDEAWSYLSKCEVLMVDESHMCPASTLERVCMGLAKNAVYRFFVSATQVRTDGTDLVLKGVTGPVVYTMTVEQGVNEGFLARPHFKMVKVRSDDKFESFDVKKMIRKHHYYNPRIIEKAAAIANAAVSQLGHKVLIQVEEIAQFTHLLRHLQHGPKFAHGGTSYDPELRKKLPEPYWKSDPPALADAFNNEEFPILVGTDCIGVGTDIKVPETIINLMGGCSSIGIPQAVGRGTRRHVYHDGRKKSEFNFVDFVPVLLTKSFNDTPDRECDDERGNSPLFRHGLLRAVMYQNLYNDVRWM